MDNRTERRIKAIKELIKRGATPGERAAAQARLDEILGGRCEPVTVKQSTKQTAMKVDNSTNERIQNVMRRMFASAGFNEDGTPIERKTKQVQQSRPQQNRYVESDGGSESVFYETVYGRM